MRNTKSRNRPEPGEERTLRPLPSATQIRLLLGTLTAIVAVIGAINLTPLMSSWTVKRLFDMNGELTLAAWLSSAILLGIGGLAALLAVYESALGRSRARVAGWWAVAALFAALSADESAMLHELVGLLTSARVVRIPGLPAVFAWVPVLAPVGIALAYGVYRWLRQTVGWRHPHGRMGLAALAIWLTVPVLEVLDPQLGTPVWLYVLEEGAEFAGEILMLGCLLGHLRQLQRRHPLSVRVEAQADAATLDSLHAHPASSQDRDRGARSSASGPGIRGVPDSRGDLARQRDRAAGLTS